MTAMTLPEELLEQLARGNGLLLVGERLTPAPDEPPLVEQWTAELAVRAQRPDAATFAEAAQAYADAAGRQALIQFLRDRAAGPPLPAHHLLAGLSECRFFVTTALDRRLERAFEAAGRPLNVVVGNVDVTFEDERQATLYKLRGTLEQPETLVLTEDDEEAFFRRRDVVSVRLQAELACRTLLFVGYDLGDAAFKRLYAEVTARLDAYARRAYAFGAPPSPRIGDWCRRHGIQVIPADTTAFLAELARQLAARRAPARAPAPPPPALPVARLPEQPYKFLDYYEPQDAPRFFGRAADTRELVARIYGHRLTLLYGASGTGKTSLLLAGAVPQLEAADPPYATVYVRVLEDPAQAIRRAVERKIASQRLNESATQRVNESAEGGLWSVVRRPLWWISWRRRRRRWAGRW